MTSIIEKGRDQNEIKDFKTEEDKGSSSSKDKVFSRQGTEEEPAMTRKHI